MSKKKQNPIQSLKEQIAKRFKDAKATLDAPARGKGPWYLDIELDGHQVIVQWQSGRGFGISCSKNHLFGEGADEVYQDEEAAYARVVSLLLSKTYTSPPESVRLRELRKERGVSQMQLASWLGKQQGAVSKIERRSDLLLSTIREVVRSMGGKLRLIATFPDGMEKSLEFDDEIESKTKRKSKQRQRRRA